MVVVQECHYQFVTCKHPIKKLILLTLFLKVLINLRNPNYENGDPLSFRTHLGLIQVPLKVKDIPELVSINIKNGLAYVGKQPLETYFSTA